MTAADDSETDASFWEQSFWSFVANAPELQPVESLVTELPWGETITMPGPFVLWSGHSVADEVPFSVAPSGRVSVNAVDDEVVFKFLEMAAALGGVVRGDEGELYRADGLGSFSVVNS